MVSIQKILEKYGNRITLRKDGEVIVFRGFLQHSMSKSRQNMKREFGLLGEIPGGQYVLLAPLEPNLTVGDVLEQGSLRVEIRRVETVMAMDKPLYQWGLCEKRGGEAAWNLSQN